MKKNNKGFSIILALFLVLSMILTAQYILSYIIPFGKNTKGIENSAKAYYEATKGLETAIYQIKDKDVLLTDTPAGTQLANTNIASVFNIDGNSNVMPPVGKGNSDYDKSFNKLSIDKPIEITFTNNDFDLNDIKLQIKLPNIDASKTEKLNIKIQDDISGDYLFYDKDGAAITAMENVPIIGWNLSSTKNTLTGTDYINLGNINTRSLGDEEEKYYETGIINLKGKNLQKDEEETTINLFYKDKDADDDKSGAGVCDENNVCKLRFFLINRLTIEANKAAVYPYLEYKLILGTGTASELISNNTHVKAEGKSYGFKRDIELDIPRESTSAAYDFTIMQ
ncbi:MAG: hypothetical protein N4A38_05045 [Candidatus Gracilibacteria bacterium]|nr:hypothetical protein [Candidatus Gracilibacteria bacterium]